MADELAPIEVVGLRVALEPRLQVASLRYFDRQGAFSHLLHDIADLTLPDTLRAVRSAADAAAEAVVLAWRSPTETWMISEGPGVIERLQGAAATVTDGCVIDQRGGLLVFRASGESVADLFARLGGYGACPAIGESRRSRLADVAVLAVKVQPDETLLVVERTYASHLMHAIRVSAADLGILQFAFNHAN
jgi:sarcosine oxidase gamma subunit